MTRYPTYGKLKQKVEELSHEVSSLKDAEEALMESQRMLSTLMGNLPGMAYRCRNDDDWTMEFVSDGCFALTGYEPHQLKWNREVSYAQLIYPEDRNEVWEGVQSAVAQKKPFRLTYRITDASGGERWVWEQGIGIFSIDDQMIALEGFISDITDNKRIEEQLSVLLESLPIVPYTCNADGHFAITYVGNAIHEITGFTPQQFMKDPTFWFDHVHPDDRKRVFGELSELFVSSEFQHEYRFRTYDMSYKWVRDIRRTVKLHDKRISHIAGTWQDITEEKRLHQESEYRLQQVIHADKLASLGEVVAGVAHEINNPNSFITNNIPLLEETWSFLEPLLEEHSSRNFNIRIGGFSVPELCDDMRTIIASIKVGSERINKVVTNLKDFARPDESDGAEPVQLNRVIEKTLNIVGAQLRKHAANIELNLSHDIPEILGYPQKLEQVVGNLVVNAAYGIPKREKGRISISTRHVKRLGTALIEIEDNGVGMEAEVLQQIFEPFFTTRRDQGGTGLGLSVSYSLIKEHGGTIGVISKPAIGTRFMIFLPLIQNSKAAIRPTILCMDDDKRFLCKLKSELSEMDTMSFEARIKRTRVMSYIEQHPEVDLILMKIMIPAEDTWKLCEEIRERFPLATLVLYGGDKMLPEGTQRDLCEPDHVLPAASSMDELMCVIEETKRKRVWVS
jgi:PAS domain S-box-containing protein